MDILNRYLSGIHIIEFVSTKDRNLQVNLKSKNCGKGLGGNEIKLCGNFILQVVNPELLLKKII
jgi:hypothetical protein